MKATELAEALTIFASYAPNVEITHMNDYRLCNYSEADFDSMTMQSRRRLSALGWHCKLGIWYLPD